MRTYLIIALLMVVAGIGAREVYLSMVMPERSPQPKIPYMNEPVTNLESSQVEQSPAPLHFPLPPPSKSTPEATVQPPTPTLIPLPPSPSMPAVAEPRIEHIGLELAEYNPVTNYAGDFLFTQEAVFHSKLWQDYGEYITETPDGKPKINPQPTYIVPLGAKVRALTNGTVVSVKQIYSGDYAIHIAKSESSQWRYELEHVTNPIVKEGDRVVAGQVIAEASPWNSHNNSGFGMFEIGVLKGGNPPVHYCPYAYLDVSVKDMYAQKILAFYRSWEEYRGNGAIYAEDAYKTPGCRVNEPLSD